MNCKSKTLKRLLSRFIIANKLLAEWDARPENHAVDEKLSTVVFLNKFVVVSKLRIAVPHRRKELLTHFGSEELLQEAIIFYKLSK